ncbi:MULTISPECIES: GNAT family N-acetyltransferase [Photobacterium]|uniref:Acetyltransferase n=1 Tax=Photobacterium ganghwense TaxID=320778 RepID=A0A0J1H0E1_9GAMM|nr:MULTISPECIES: GNAT family protein [Photobacterium]KLV05298.1 acetyltransferase [Photobacterium ganghwense]PSU05787.1 N-acetyltransferase [Photobacterium ganghwense]QSV14794.1 GNAT family N-acetyltransferase [Photobacterium ganghwense]
MFTIETRRLRLRDMQPEDTEAFVALTRDEKYRRFYHDDDCTPAHYRQLAALFMAQAQECPRTHYQLAVELKATGQFIGIACLRTEADRQAAIGCGLNRHYHGKQLMEEAADALMTFGFTQCGLHRVYAETLSANVPALRLCRLLGMRQEARFKQHRFFKDQWWDTIVMAILRNEWEQRSPRC